MLKYLAEKTSPRSTIMDSMIRLLQNFYKIQKSRCAKICDTSESKLVEKYLTETNKFSCFTSPSSRIRTKIPSTDKTPKTLSKESLKLPLSPQQSPRDFTVSQQKLRYIVHGPSSLHNRYSKLGPVRTKILQQRR